MCEIKLKEKSEYDFSDKEYLNLCLYRTIEFEGNWIVPVYSEVQNG